MWPFDLLEANTLALKVKVPGNIDTLAGGGGGDGGAMDIFWNYTFTFKQPVNKLCPALCTLSSNLTLKIHDSNNIDDIFIMNSICSTTVIKSDTFPVLSLFNLTLFSYLSF